MKTWADIGKYENGFEKGFHQSNGLYYVQHNLDYYWITKDIFDTIQNEKDCKRIIAEQLKERSKAYETNFHMSTQGHI